VRGWPWGLGTGLSPSLAPCPWGPPPPGRSRRTHPSRPQPRGGLPPVTGLGSSRFAHCYWGNPHWLLFLRLVICLSLSGGPTRAEAAVRRREGAARGPPLPSPLLPFFAPRGLRVGPPLPPFPSALHSATPPTTP